MDGLSHQADLAKAGRRHGLAHPQRLDAGIGEGPVEGVDGPGRHADGVHGGDPFVRGPGFGPGLDQRVEFVPVLETRLGRGEALIVDQFLGAQRLAELLPHGGHGREEHVPVRGPESVGRHVGRVVVARLARHVAVHGVARGLEIQEEDAGLHQRGLHPLAFAGPLPLEQRQHDAVGQQRAGHHVRDGRARAHRPLARMTGNRHVPAHRLDDRVEPGPLGVRPVLAEGRDAGINDPGVDRLDAFVVDAEAGLHVRAVILDDDVGALRHPLEHPDALFRLEVERHAPLVAVQVLEVRRVAGREILVPAQPRRLDLDHVGAPVGHLAPGGGPGPGEGHLQNGDVLQDIGGGLKRHVAVLSGGIFLSLIPPRPDENRFGFETSGVFAEWTFMDIHGQK